MQWLSVAPPCPAAPTLVPHLQRVTLGRAPFRAAEAALLGSFIVHPYPSLCALELDVTLADDDHLEATLQRIDTLALRTSGLHITLTLDIYATRVRAKNSQERKKASPGMRTFNACAS